MSRTPDLARRSHARVPLRARVCLELAEERCMLVESAVNVSSGGMFVRSETPRRVGESLRLELRLGPRGPVIPGTGEVVWVRRSHDGSTRPPGFGVRFLELDEAGRRLLDELARTYLEEGVEAFRAALEEAGLAVRDVAPEVDAPTPPPSVPPPAPTTAGTAGDGAVATLAGETASSRGDLTPEAEGRTDRENGAARPAAAAGDDGPADAREAAPAAAPDPAPGPASPATAAAASAVGFDTDALAAAGGEESAWPADDAPGPVEPAVAGEEPPDRDLELAPDASPRRSGLLVAGLAALLAVGGLVWWTLRSGGGVASTAPAPPGAAVTTPAPGGAATFDDSARDEAAPPAAAFGAVTGIEWHQQGEEVLVAIATDGYLPPGSWRHAHLGGESPREVIRLFGVRRAYEAPVLEADHPLLRRIRTGYHPGGNGNEQRIVLDLGGTGARVAVVETDGTRLLIRLVPTS